MALTFCQASRARDRFFLRSFSNDSLLCFLLIPRLLLERQTPPGPTSFFHLDDHQPTLGVHWPLATLPTSSTLAPLTTPLPCSKNELIPHPPVTLFFFTVSLLLLIQILNYLSNLCALLWFCLLLRCCHWMVTSPDSCLHSTHSKPQHPEHQLFIRPCGFPINRYFYLPFRLKNQSFKSRSW